MVEGSTHEVERTFHLTLGKPVSFPLYSSTTSSTATTSAVGLLVKGEDLEPLPPLQAVLQQRDEVPVRLRATLTEVGTLELSLQMMPEALDRFGLTFSTRAASDATAKPGAASSEPIAARIDEAKDMVAAYFGNKSKDVDPKGVKNLRRDLEKMLGAREQWSTAVNRELAGTLLAGSARRRRSAEHERAFFQLLGWCMRPGFGAPFDEWRVSELWPLFAEGVQHVSEKPTWASWWILWRRIAGGLDADKQRAIHDATAPWLLQQGTGKPGKGPTPHGQDEMVRLLASLERLPAAAKEELGRFVVKKLGRGGITSYWPLGRLGARQPLAGSAHDVVPAAVAAEWLKKVLEADLKTAEGAAFATVELARLTGDRARDLDVALREAAAVRLEKADRPSWARMLREVVPLSLEDEATAFGDALPVGLKLGP
jgi:hypothetical protein